MTTKTAVIIGVGPEKGLGACLGKYAAREGLHVFLAGRTPEKLLDVCSAIEAEGGRASPFQADTTNEKQVAALIREAEATGPVDLAIYNAGNNYHGDFLGMSVEFFEKAWRVGTLGGFIFAREALKVMSPREKGTLIFTGASASMRGKPYFAAFTAAKAGLRALSQSLAREFQPKGIHVAHVVIDGGIEGDKILKNFPDFAERVGKGGLIGLDGIAETYMHLYRQPKNAWTHEMDLRTFKEAF